MSDGPHRTLPSRPHWKTFAQRAASAAHTVEEVDESLSYALQRDILQAPIKAIRDIMEGDSLFKIEQLEALRLHTAGSAVSNNMIECAIVAASNGLNGEAGTLATLQMTLEETVRTNFRGIEEHYQREAAPQSRQFIRQRLDAATRLFNGSALARHILASQNPLSLRSVKLPVRSGLDQGPAL